MSEQLYHLFHDGQQTGPFTLPQLRAMWKNGSANALTQFYTEARGEWLALTTISDLLDSAPQVGRNDGSKQTPIHALEIQSRMKSVGVAALLAILFPFIGCFYSAPIAALLCGGISIFFLWLNAAPDTLGNGPMFLGFIAFVYLISIACAISGAGRHNRKLIAKSMAQ